MKDPARKCNMIATTRSWRERSSGSKTAAGNTERVFPMLLPPQHARAGAACCAQPNDPPTLEMSAVLVQTHLLTTISFDMKLVADRTMSCVMGTRRPYE
eukprot:2931367-Pleurochrysis_carterae.AAC.3